ncbi:MAG: hypothetical protein LBC28_03755, partial [Oscillospiraceae bacterium]|nr:hypothetical protein [Oscillospiraceae bacterium]
EEYFSGDELADGDDEGYKVITKDGSYTGNTYKAVVPGDILAKRPRVVNTGSIPVYVKVEGALYAEKDGDIIDITDWLGQTEDGANALALAAFIKSIAIDDNWAGVDTKISEDGKALVGTWYYVNGTDTSKYALKELAVSGETDDIFKQFTVPLSLENVFENVTISLELTAYAVQSTNNPYFSTAKGYDELDYAWEIPATTPEA